MWIWIAVIAVVLVVFLVARALARGSGGTNDVGLHRGSDATLQGLWAGSADPSGDRADTAGGWWSGDDGGWDGGDGG